MPWCPSVWPGGIKASTMAHGQHRSCHQTQDRRHKQARRHNNLKSSSHNVHFTAPSASKPQSLLQYEHPLKLPLLPVHHLHPAHPPEGSPWKRGWARMVAPCHHATAISRSPCLPADHPCTCTSLPSFVPNLPWRAPLHCGGAEGPHSLPTPLLVPALPLLRKTIRRPFLHIPAGVHPPAPGPVQGGLLQGGPHRLPGGVQCGGGGPLPGQEPGAPRRGDVLQGRRVQG